MKAEINSHIENQRLLFSTAIVAGFFAYTQSNTYLSNYFTEETLKVVGIVMMLSAFLSFMYLLTSAAAIKFQEPASIKFFSSSAFQRKSLYNLSVDIFILATWALLAIKFAKSLGIDNTTFEQSSIKIAVALVFSLIVVFSAWKTFLEAIAYIHDRQSNNLKYKLFDLFASIVAIVILLWVMLDIRNDILSVLVKVILSLILLRGLYSAILSLGIVRHKAKGKLNHSD